MIRAAETEVKNESRSAPGGVGGEPFTPGALVELSAPDFNLDQTIGCGQVFHWRRVGAGYAGTIGDRAVYVEQRGDRLLVPGGTEEIARDYFGLDHPVSEIYATFPGDPAMQEALRFCRGLRLIRQPLWECVATFITSSMKQVAHIAQMSHAIRTRFGKSVTYEGLTLHTYPSPEELAKATEAELRACSLGYRAKNLLGSARMIASGEVDLDAIARMPDDRALAELCRLPGVGEKVANCALLFAFGRYKAFPIDVWIERVLREIYFRGKRLVTTRRLREFSASYFGPYGGYAQQYLFHHARMNWKTQRPPKRQKRAKAASRKKAVPSSSRRRATSAKGSPTESATPA